MTIFTGALGALRIDPLIVTGISLWALTLYLALARLRLWTVETLLQLNTSWSSTSPDPEKRPSNREGQGEFWASLLSIVPFLIGGGLCYYSLVWSLGQSWAISFGIMGVILSGIYELARTSGAAD
jgi:hypothetical protein